MIIAIIEFIFLAGIGSILHYFLWQKFGLIILNSAISMFPGVHDPTTVIFIKAILYWFILLMMLGGLFHVIVLAQRTRPEGYI